MAALLAGCQSKPPVQEPLSPILADLVDYRTALAMMREGRVDEAIQLLRRARVTSPEDANVPNALGLAFLYKKDYASAVKSFSEALALDPNMVEAHGNRGVAYMELGKPEQAETEFASVLASSNQQEKLNAHYNLGLLQKRRTRWADAEREFSTVLTEDPLYRKAYKERGAVRLRQENFRGALEDMLQVLKDDPNDAQANYQAALCLLTTGRRDLARKYMERAVAAAPESDEGKRARRFLSTENQLEEAPR